MTRHRHRAATVRNDNNQVTSESRAAHFRPTMVSFRSAALAALILALGVAEGFVPADGMILSHISAPPLAMCPGGEKNESENDPTKVWYAGVADVVQNFLTNSPLNEGKKALVKSLAGDYDVEATRAKLNGLIDNEPVLFLSFVR